MATCIWLAKNHGIFTDQINLNLLDYQNLDLDKNNLVNKC